MSPIANFDRVASVYQSLEYLSFGPLLERCRWHFIPKLRTQKRALLIGDGDGRFAAKLLTENVCIQAEAIDTSAAMLQIMKRRVKFSQRLTTHRCDALGFLPNGRFDLVATHFFLDCLTSEEVSAVVELIAPHVEDKGYWLVSEFQIPQGSARPFARVLIRCLYMAFRIMTGLRVREIPNYQNALLAKNFTLECEQKFLFEMLTTQLWRKVSPN